MLKLEAGKRYWRRDGGVSAALRWRPSLANSTGEFTDDIGSWNESGRWSACGETPYDLVREYTEPQPLEWKRGIPTEEECRECWIVEGGVRDFPNGHGDVYAPEILCFAETQVFSEDSWYLPLRIKPVEPPKSKTRTVTLQQFTHTSGDKRWMVVEDGEMAGCWTATGKTKTVEVPCE